MLEFLVHPINSYTHKKNKVKYINFVEVKKPDEPFRQDQVTELKFLNEIKTKARVLRLIERD